jgi:hypothetical protein
MAKLIIANPNCIDCYDWTLSGLMTALIPYVAIIILGGILIQIIIHFFKKHEMKVKILDALYWMVLLIILEVGYFCFQSILLK